MINVASSQFTYGFGNQLHFPYSIAILVSYIKHQKEFNGKFNFLQTAVDRYDFNYKVEQFGKSDILICSCYPWGWEMTKELARRVKKLNPKCLTIFGGPRCPDDCKTFLEENDYVDIMVHHEGEIVLSNIFRAYINGDPMDDIKSVSTVSSPNWTPENLIKDMTTIPSPYLDGTIYDLVKTDPTLKWVVTWETMRGCPYACSYCAWGKSAYDTVRKFDLKRLYKEIDWMADHKIDYIDCADANFGMFERDIEITRYIKQKKISTGYPITFKPSWAKKITPKLLSIAKELK
jgi:radical SAM superfamily enzyme YgiQ (UPF0313 family)